MWARGRRGSRRILSEGQLLVSRGFGFTGVDGVRVTAPLWSRVGWIINNRSFFPIHVPDHNPNMRIDKIR